MWPGDLEARDAVRDVGDLDAILQMAIEPAHVEILRPVARGQAKVVLGQARNGEIPHDPPRRRQHGRQRQPPRLRNAPRHDPVEPGARIWPPDGVLAEILHLVDTDALAHRTHLARGGVPCVGAAERTGSRSVALFRCGLPLRCLRPHDLRRSNSPPPARTCCPQTAPMASKTSYMGVVRRGRAAGSSSLG